MAAKYHIMLNGDVTAITSSLYDETKLAEHKALSFGFNGNAPATAPLPKGNWRPIAPKKGSFKSRV